MKQRDEYFADLYKPSTERQPEASLREDFPFATVLLTAEGSMSNQMSNIHFMAYHKINGANFASELWYT